LLIANCTLQIEGRRFSGSYRLGRVPNLQFANCTSLLATLWLVVLSHFVSRPAPLIASEPLGDTGSIEGSVEAPAGSLAAVFAVDRTSGKKIAGTIDAETGKFRIEGLKLDAAFDVIIDFKPATGSALSVWRLEGANMKVPRSEYEEEQPLSAEDIATVKEKIRGLNQFEDVVEIIAIDGNIQHAAVLVNKLRTKPFYESKPGEIIWRPELWHFERPDDTWVKVQDELFVILYRERIQQSEFAKRSVTFDSSLGGVRPTAESPRVDFGSIKLPDAKPGVRYRGAGSVTRPAQN